MFTTKCRRSRDWVNFREVLLDLRTLNPPVDTTGLTYCIRKYLLELRRAVRSFLVTLAGEDRQARILWEPRISPRKIAEDKAGAAR
jgi:hypothetical protein